MPICTKCGKDVPATTQPGQDNTTFVCEECQNKVDLPAWKKEAEQLTNLKDKANTSQLRRLEFLERKIAESEAQG